MNGTQIIILNFPGLIGIVSFAFILLLMLKVSTQPTTDSTAKTLFLILLLGLFALSFAILYTNFRLFRIWPHLSFISAGFIFWIGPALYQYVQKVAFGQDSFKQSHRYLHWLPGLMIELALMPYFFMGLEQKITLLTSPEGIFLRSKIWLAIYLHILIYIFLCQPLLRIYQRRILDNYSNTAEINLRWIKFFCYGFVVFLVVETYVLVFGILSIFQVPSGLAAYYLKSIVFMFMVVVSYSALGQSRLHFVSELGKESNKEKYTRSGLREDSTRFYLEKLSKLMEFERYYLESDISLSSLARKLELRPHHLSQLLNEHLGKNFYDYINEQRIKYSKELLTTAPSKSIKEIAFESGYNNKYSFYNSFKQYEKVTPSDFRRQNLQLDNTLA